MFIERTALVPKAVQDILTSKCFDNGTICASEQAVVVDAPIEQEVREQFKAQGAHFVSSADADKLAKIVATPQRTLNPAIVGKSVEVIAKLAGISVPPGTRCLMVEVGGVGRDFPLSMEKLSPILAFYVEDGLERGASRCLAVLSYGGMGHTAGIHTRSRDAATKYGLEMPASRICVNTPTTHGAIGFSTALSPSMTLGCGSWGGNVTSDNVSPIHLMDIKRVAFETRPVASSRPAVAATTAQSSAGGTGNGPGSRQSGTISREEISNIVDRFLANRPPDSAPAVVEKPFALPQDAGAENRSAGPASSAIPQPAATAYSSDSGNGSAAQRSSAQISDSKSTAPVQGTENGRKIVDFVCEDDVRRAIQKGDKIYVSARTIITPAARDLGESSEVFAKG